MATIIAAVGGGDWNTGASWVGGSAPTAADSAQVTSASGNMQIGTGAVARGADFSTYTGTVSLTANTLTIGDATAALSNIAMKMVAGMTTSAFPINFISTSATVQTVDFASKTTGSVTFNATSNGNWQYTGGHTIGAAGILTLTQGTLDINGQTTSWGQFSSNNSNTRILTLGAANIILTGVSINSWDCTTATNFTVDAGTSTLTLTGLNGSFSGGTNKIYNTVILQGGGTMNLGTTTTYANLTITGGAIKANTTNIFGTQTITNALSLNGNSAINRLAFFSSTAGTTRTIITTGATFTSTFTDYMDVSLTSAKDFSGQTDIGDAGGNSGITFPASVNQIGTIASGKNWSDITIWSGGRVPLPQDDIFLSGVTGGSLVADMPRLGRSIDWTGATGNPTWTFGSTPNSIYGSVILISGMTISGTQALTFAGRGSYAITSAGKTFTQALTIAAPTGTYTLRDPIISSSGTGFNVNNGTFNTNNFSVTVATLRANAATNTRGITLGTSTVTLTSTSVTSLWNPGSATGLILSAASATFVISTATASTRTFDGGSFTYGTLTYTVAGSTGQLNITGSNSFAAINFSDATNARTLAFTAATTTVITTQNGFNVDGTAGKLMSVQSITAATHTLTSSFQQTCDYLSITNSIAVGGPWYAGSHSVDNGGNSGWIFTDPPNIGGNAGGTTLLLGV